MSCATRYSPSQACWRSAMSLAIPEPTPPSDLPSRRPDGSIRSSAPCWAGRSEEHTSELQSLMRISYAVFCLKNKRSNNRPPVTPRPTTSHLNLHEQDCKPNGGYEI